MEQVGVRNRDDHSKGAFSEESWKAWERGAFTLTPRVRADLIAVLSDSLETLGLAEDPEIIVDSFIKLGYVEEFIRARPS